MVALKIAVLTLTRDRLDYTQHCFGRLRELAGCDFDHFVLDQGSTDGTAAWLRSEYRPHALVELVENIGIHRGLNTLLDLWIDRSDTEPAYDVVVSFDNDCELLMLDTLRDVAELAIAGDAILSPRVQGLRNPPAPVGEFVIDGDLVDEVQVMGAIFRAAPAHVFTTGGFRFNEGQPLWGGDEQTICAWARDHGMRLGYVRRLAVNHYETTDGQVERYPWYFERRVLEGGPAR